MYEVDKSQSQAILFSYEILAIQLQNFILLYLILTLYIHLVDELYTRRWVAENSKGKDS